MFKYMFILMFVFGMMGYSLVASAGPGPLIECEVDCDARIKCVCESKFGGAVRVVPCPDVEDRCFDSLENGTLEANCADDNCTCDLLDIHCKWWERPNCVATLGMEVEVECPIAF